ncbi:MAG: carbon starvation protein A [bacterium]
MNSMMLMLLSFVGYIIAYRTYGQFLSRKVFGLNVKAVVPANRFEDGQDYVPTKKGVIFGHHYASIAGTGPIVGPAIGIIWGWVPAFLWVFLGSIIMGGVHDLGSLILSMRHQGKSISEITARYINRRTRLLFFLIVFFELLLVVAVFGLVIAVIFSMFPQSVFPIWCEIPIAVFLGYMVYNKKGNVTVFTALAVILMYITVVAGHFLPLKMPALGHMPATGVWTVILLIYAYIASILPVTTLLQPRDYINAWELFVAMGLLIAGILVAGAQGKIPMVAPAFNLHPENAPSLWPFLFITIACGAISGFHSLVSSGTTAKQVSSELDAQFVGYGSMLLESILSLLVIIACGAGLGMAYTAGNGSLLTGFAAWQAHYGNWAGASGLSANINAFVIGSANMMTTFGLPRAIAIIIMGVFVASFAGTTLDTATRIQRYVISELASDFHLNFLKGRWTATALAVITAFLLAFATGPDGKGALTLWPLFGAVNQLLAGLALIVLTIYLRRKGPYYWVALIPCIFMMVMTLWGMIMNLRDYFSGGNWCLVIIGSLCFLLAIWMCWEAFLAFVRPSFLPKEEGVTWQPE